MRTTKYQGESNTNFYLRLCKQDKQENLEAWERRLDEAVNAYYAAAADLKCVLDERSVPLLPMSCICEKAYFQNALDPDGIKKLVRDRM